jgi:hypothetical protein
LDICIQLGCRNASFVCFSVSCFCHGHVMYIRMYNRMYVIQAFKTQMCRFLWMTESMVPKIQNQNPIPKQVPVGAGGDFLQAIVTPNMPTSGTGLTPENSILNPQLSVPKDPLSDYLRTSIPYTETHAYTQHTPHAHTYTQCTYKQAQAQSLSQPLVPLSPLLRQV